MAVNRYLCMNSFCNNIQPNSREFAALWFEEVPVPQLLIAMGVGFLILVKLNGFINWVILKFFIKNKSIIFSIIIVNF